MLRLDAYTTRDIQHAAGMVREAMAKGMDIASLEAALAATMRQRIKPPPSVRARAVLCTACGTPALAVPVNVSAATMTGDQMDRVAIVCRAKGCLHVEYSHETLGAVRARAVEVEI